LPASPFSVIADEFDGRLASLRQLPTLPNRVDGGPASKGTRIAVVHATTLLLSATFEEFVRLMAREFATQVVNNTGKLPDKVLEAAWKQTFGELARKAPGGRNNESEIRDKIDLLFAFLGGDAKQGAFRRFIRNEGHLRIREINRLFKVVGINNICCEVCGHDSLFEFFDLEDRGRTHIALARGLDDFFRRRNDITHSLESVQSMAPDMIEKDINMFQAFSSDLSSTLETKAPVRQDLTE